ncbi:MAG: LEA type 2 family protein [Gammaproteobacteria bacterium]|nr:LEA type 2 family protein [Gammaproteobacteria bacterium]
MLNLATLLSHATGLDDAAGKRFTGKSTLPRVLLFATALSLFALIAACASTGGLANPPRVSLAGLRLAEVGLMEQRYAASLRIQNPNDASLSVRGMEYTIYLNDRKFADGVSDRQFSVPAYGEKLIEVNLTSTVRRVFEQFKNLSNGESQEFRYRIAGSLSLAGLRSSLPFSHEDAINLSAGGG